ncbi:MAG: T9SS type A sorting domain-containing protein [Candidatus Marinimicrobia bacterium]|nr:T9SS type A sorting domain-containing protein [Candidatus Neomarinimicrobiota bacterium]
MIKKSFSSDHHKKWYIFILIMSYNLCASSGWQWQNPLPQGDHLWDVWVFDSTHVLAVGHYGTIIKSDDGGETWAFPESNTWNNLFSVQFLTDSTGWACGSGGVLLKTEDGGDNWVSHESGTTYTLYAIFFIDNLTGFLVGSGGKIFKTINGGDSWLEQESSTGNALFSAYFINEYLGWSVGDMGTVIKTSDGGQTWTNIESGVITQLQAVFFISDSIGWVCGTLTDSVGASPAFLKTTDGGENWLIEMESIQYDLHDMFFINSDTGGVMGSGIYLSTFDSGNSWIENLGVSGVSIHFSCPNYGWTVGSVGSIHKTTDSGFNWTEKRKGPTEYLKAITFVDSNMGFTAGWGLGPTRGVILKTIDGGSNWELMTVLENVPIFDIIFLNDEVGYIIGDSATVYGAPGLVYKTINGGQSWSTNFIGTVPIGGITFTDDSTGWIVGWDGQIYITTDSGNTWEQQVSGIENDPFNNLFSVFFIDSNTGYAGGDNIILKTSTGGDLWEPNLGLYGTIYDIKFVNDSTGWAVGGGQGGLIFKTVNRGNSWLQQSSGTSSWLTSINFINSDTGWITGNNGIFLKTISGGNTWIHERVTSLDLEDTYFLDHNTGWIVGEHGTILKTTTGGTSMEVVNNQQPFNLPETYMLSQNFPNPFNASTIIEYHMTQASQVTITIYNILGQEVIHLVNKTQLPGSYKVYWDGTSASGRYLSSGIYIYKLVTDKFVDTKKMLLIR